MPIKIVSVYAASDGEKFRTERDAVAHEIQLLVPNDTQLTAKNFGQWVVQNAPAIKAILDAKPDAPPKRKPRSDRGGNHKRKEKICHGAAVNRELQDMKQ